MFNLMIISTCILFICIIIMCMASLLSKKLITDREKSSPFECGFDPINSSRFPFSIQFFLIAIIFLIFDVEIALILPIIITMKYSNIMMWFTTNSIFIFILLIGLFHEWKQGALNWSF